MFITQYVVRAAIIEASLLSKRKLLCKRGKPLLFEAMEYLIRLKEIGA